MKKLTTRERRLLKLLGAAVAACAFLALLAFKLPELRDLNQDIGLREERIGTMQALQVNEADLAVHYDRLVKALAEEKERYYAPEDRDMTRLGMKMLSLIRKNGLSYTRLNKVTSREGNYVEVALNGAIVNVMRLLDDVYTNPKYLNVEFLSIANKGGQASVTMRMNYGENAPLAP